MLRKDPRSSGRTAHGDLYNHGKGNKCWRLSDVAKSWLPQGEQLLQSHLSVHSVWNVWERGRSERLAGVQDMDLVLEQTSESCGLSQAELLLTQWHLLFLSLVVVFCLVVFAVVVVVWLIGFLVGLLIWFHCFQIHFFKKVSASLTLPTL